MLVPGPQRLGAGKPMLLQKLLSTKSIFSHLQTMWGNYQSFEWESESHSLPVGKGLTFPEFCAYCAYYLRACGISLPHIFPPSPFLFSPLQELGPLVLWPLLLFICIVAGLRVQNTEKLGEPVHFHNTESKGNSLGSVEYLLANPY